jgi:hypothetical protein
MQREKLETAQVIEDVQRSRALAHIALGLVLFFSIGIVIAQFG